MASKQFDKTDVPIPSGVPKAFAGQRQLDGTPTTHFSPPFKRGDGKPGSAPKYSLADRAAIPDRPTDSGMEASMQAHADKQHPRKGY